MLKVVEQEVGHVLTYLGGDGVRVFEGAGLVGDITLYDAHYAIGVNLHIGFADAVVGLGYHDGGAKWVVLYLIDIVDTYARLAVESVEFNDYALLGQTGYRGADTACGCKVYACLVADDLYLAGL